MLTPEEFARDIRQASNHNYVARLIAARDAEVREAKRREVLDEVQQYAARPIKAEDAYMLEQVLKLPSLKPITPVPSERAMRVAEKWLGPAGRTLSEQDHEASTVKLALLIDAEFGAGTVA